MCGIAGHPRPLRPLGRAARAAAHDGRDAPPRARRRGLVRRPRRRPRQPPARHHRPHRRRPPADVQRGRLGLDHLQRHALQLPRAARASSSAAGHRFRSASDTEVIVHAYEEWGDGLPACASTACSRSRSGTRSERRLMAARDRFGVKPLYWTRARRAARVRLGAQGRARGRRAARASTRRRSSSTSRSRTSSPTARCSPACTRCRRAR